jgi:hypothetical protein
MRKSAAVLVVGIAFVWAVPATAGPSQAGCQAYGAFVAGAAQGGDAGAFVSGIATSGSGAVADFAASLKQTTC